MIVFERFIALVEYFNHYALIIRESLFAIYLSNEVNVFKELGQTWPKHSFKL